jgi:hypothetical protein
VRKKTWSKDEEPWLPELHVLWRESRSASSRASRVADIRAGDRRDPGAQARELMPQRRNAGLGQVVPDQLRSRSQPFGRWSARLSSAATMPGRTAR